MMGIFVSSQWKGQDRWGWRPLKEQSLEQSSPPWFLMLRPNKTPHTLINPIFSESWVGTSAVFYSSCSCHAHTGRVPIVWRFKLLAHILTAACCTFLYHGDNSRLRLRLSFVGLMHSQCKIDHWNLRRKEKAVLHVQGNQWSRTKGSTGLGWT